MPVTIYNGSFTQYSGLFNIGPAAGSVGPSIVTDGLVLYLDPNNASSYPGSGTTFSDLSGNGNNGTLTNTPVYSESSLGGKIFTFNGTTQYIDLNGYASLDNGQATYQLWIRDGDSSDVGSNRQFIARTNTNAGTFNILKRVTTGAIGVNFRSNADPATQINYNSSYVLNTCYTFITVTYDGSFIRLYSNGAEIDPVSQSAAGAIDTAGTATINVARNTTGAAYFTGSIGPIIMYNRALSASEITQNYDIFSSLYPSLGISCF